MMNGNDLEEGEKTEVNEATGADRLPSPEIARPRPAARARNQAQAGSEEVPPAPEDPEKGQWVSFEKNEEEMDPGDLGAASSAKLPPPPLRPRAKKIEQPTLEGADVAEINVAMEETTPQKPTRTEPAPFQPKKVAPTEPSLTTTSTSSYPTPASNGTSTTSAASSALSAVNGKKITTISPDNHLCPWIIPSKFNCYKIPKSLISNNITMPVEDFVNAMRTLTNDYRFMLYVTLYRRVIVIWVLLMIALLFVLLVSNVARGVMVFVLVLIWIFLIAVGILGCLFVKKKIHKGLHKVVAEVNQTMSKHNILIGVDDRGKLSCHKIAIHFISYRLQDCIPKMARIIRQHEAAEAARYKVPRVALRINYDDNGMPEEDLSDEDKARLLLLKYSQSWVKGHVRHRIKFPSRPSEGVSDVAPLHCTTSYCLCQYVEQYHFEKKLQKSLISRCLFIGDLNIRELEAPAFYGGGYPAMMYAHM